MQVERKRVARKWSCKLHRIAPLHFCALVFHSLKVSSSAGKENADTRILFVHLCLSQRSATWKKEEDLLEGDRGRRRHRRTTTIH